MTLPEAHSSCVRPVVFETGIEAAPHSVFGSSFLVGYRERIFVITARHVIQPEGQTHPLCVRSPAGCLFTLKDVFFVPVGSVLDDWADLAAVEIDLTQTSGDMGDTNIIPLNEQSEDWIEVRHDSAFVLVGFPKNTHLWISMKRKSLKD